MQSLILGFLYDRRSRNEYCDWIRKENSWGGAIGKQLRLFHRCAAVCVANLRLVLRFWVTGFASVSNSRLILYGLPIRY